MNDNRQDSRRALKEIEAAIVRGHRAGVCDGEGHSVRNAQGAFVAKPRARRPTAKWVKGMGWVSLI